MFRLLQTSQRLVVVAPHPDDETLGCGLLIAEAVRLGVPLAVVVLTDGEGSRAGSLRWPPDRLASLRRGELSRALARFGAKHVPIRRLGWRDGGVADSGNALRLRRLFVELRAGVVLAASPVDFHADHRAGWRLVEQAVAGTRTSLAAYAVWSRLDAMPKRQRHRALAAKHYATQAHRSQIAGRLSDEGEGFTFDRATLRRLVFEPEHYVFRSARRRRPVPAAGIEPATP